MIRELWWDAMFHVVKTVRPMDSVELGVKAGLYGMLAGTVAAAVWYMRRGR